MRLTLAAAAVVLAVAAAGAHRPEPVRSTGVRERHPYRVRGALHVHTGASPDALGDLDSVVGAARRAGLDFLGVTEHTTEAGLLARGWRDGVLLLGGLEKSTDAGHALVLGLDSLPFRLDGDPETVVRDVTELGGFVVAAHPASADPEGRWGTGTSGLAGLEVVNLGEPGAWGGRGLRLVAPAVRYAMDPQAALLSGFRFSRQPLVFWDEALRWRPIAGLLGSDAHGGFRAGRFPIPLPSHEAVFRFASQHLLLREALRRDDAHDTRVVLDAIRSGRGYVALDTLAPASGFLFEGQAGDRRALMGESLPLPMDADVELQAEADAPRGTVLVLLRDGHEVTRGERIHYRTREPGVYRVEAYLIPGPGPALEGIPWILSNPIAVFPPAELLRREVQAAQLPREDLPPPRWDIIDDFAAGRLRSEWQTDHARDADARVREEDGALRFDWALGRGPRTHASVCEWRARDLTPYEGIALRLRSDRQARLDVQVRVADDAAPGGVRIWRRSVRARPDWRDVAIPFASLRTYDRRGGSPNLAQNRGIYFHVDESHFLPGSRGTFWLDDVGLVR